MFYISMEVETEGLLSVKAQKMIELNTPKKETGEGDGNTNETKDTNDTKSIEAPKNDNDDKLKEEVGPDEVYGTGGDDNPEKFAKPENYNNTEGNDKDTKTAAGGDAGPGMLCCTIL